MVITQTYEDIYLNFLYIGLNVIRLSSYLLFTLLDLGLYSKHYLRVMDSLYYPLLVLNWYMLNNIRKINMYIYTYK